MKSTLTVLLVLFISFSFAQWNTNFSSGNLQNPVLWIGDIDSFEVINEELHLNAPPNTEESYISTISSSAVNGSWEFILKLDFNPSSSNQAFAYLISNNQNLKAPLNGYFVKLGGTLDNISLYRQDGNNSTLLINGVVDLLDNSSTTVKVKITRGTNHHWELYADTSLTLNNYEYQGNATDATYLASDYFGFLCDYTSTRSDKFYFDDIVISSTIYVDDEAPQVSSFNILSPYSIEISLTENLTNASANNLSNFHLASGPLINSLIYLSTQNKLILQLGSPMIRNQSYELQLANLSDSSFNLLDTSLMVSIKDNYNFNEIYVNEIYPDETPSYGMPAYEFIEITNTTGDSLFTMGWTLSDNLDEAEFPADTIMPYAITILSTVSGYSAYKAYGKTIPIFGMPGWNNTSDLIILKDKYGTTIDSVAYNKDWHEDNTDSLGNSKKEGGYSLERIGFERLCIDSIYWNSSIENLGASPGTINSLNNINILNPSITHLQVIGNNELSIIFNAPIPINLNTLVPNINNYENGNSLAFQNTAYEPTNLELTLSLNDSLHFGTPYTIEMDFNSDCFGQAFSLLDTFYRYKPIQANDIIINEILFNPKTGGSDYIELYNRTNETFSFDDLSIAELDPFDLNIALEQHQLNVSDNSIEPSSFIVLSSDTLNTLENYTVLNEKWLFECAIPNFPDNSGCIALLLYDTIVIDQVCYNTNWHLSLLSSTEGVALERINPHIAGQSAYNWHSASATAGHGTPTGLNSQHYSSPYPKTLLSVSPEVFTPNGDGVLEFSVIQFKIDTSGYIANTSIFDVEGREVRNLSYNQLLGTEATWKWDGLNNSGRLMETGIYIVIVNIFQGTGKRHRFAKKIVLGSKLN